MDARLSVLAGLSLCLVSLCMLGCPASTNELRTNQNEGGKLDTERAELAKFVEEGRARNDKKYRIAYKKRLTKYAKLADENPESTRYRYLYGFLLVNPKKKWNQFNQCLRNNATHFWCLIGQGHVYVTWGVKDRAQADFTAAQKVRPQSLEPIVGLAEVAMLRKQDDQAISLFKRVLAKKSDHRDALYGIAILHQRQGKNDAAIGYYERLLKANPTHYPSLKAVGNLQHKAKRWQASADALARAITIRKRSFRLIIKLAAIYETHLNLPAKALDLYERASKLPQSHFHTYYRLGVLRGKNGRVARGIGALKQAVRLQPDHPDAQLQLGKLYLKNKDGAKATPTLWKALRLNNGNIESRIALAKSLELTKDYAGVLQQYTAILKLAPKREDVRTSMAALLTQLGLSNQTYTSKSARTVYNIGKKKVYKCYKARLKEKPKLKGNVNIKIRISATGSVERVSILLEKTTLEDKLVHACIKWTYGLANFPRLSRPRAFAISGLLEFRR